jgi:tetratricopeptide (TPR) repeat protein
VLVGGRDGLALRVLNPFDPGLAYVASLSGPAREALGRETEGLLAVWPGNHLARQTDLALKLSAGAYPDAYETARRLRSEFPGEARYAYAAGLALRGLGRDAAALDEFQRTLRLDPEFGPAYAAAGEAALGAGRYDVGARIMEAYGEQRRQRLTAEEYALLGDLRHRRGRPREAVRAYERALWLAADAGELRARIENNAGSAYLELGEPQAALPHLEAALRARRPFPEAELNRARAWARGGRTAEAREVFRRLAADAALPPDVRTRAQTELAGPAR